MAKSKAGLPEGFELNLDTPSTLGDYLDEDFSGNAARVIVAKRAAAQPEPVLKAKVEAPYPPPRTEPKEDVAPVTLRNDSVLDLNEARRKSAPKAAVFKRPERVQFNMRPETVKMLDEVVEFVQRYSLQADAKTSEIFDAMIGVLYDAKKEMAFNDVPRRGQWGTPTARAFSTALGTAFARAIANRFRKTTEGEGQG